MNRSRQMDKSPQNHNLWSEVVALPEVLNKQQRLSNNSQIKMSQTYMNVHFKNYNLMPRILHIG